MTGAERPERPYVVVSVAMSADGYIDDASDTRLVLSAEADRDRVDELRAQCDAVLVGANTVRRDDPKLVLRSPARRKARTARGESPDPVKVTVTGRGQLDGGSRFFTTGSGDKLVYCAAGTAGTLTGHLPRSADVVALSVPVTLAAVLADLRGRGVLRLLAEGGGEVQAQLLSAGLVDELHLFVAPLLVADQAAPRFAGSPGGARWPLELRLAGVETLGGVAHLHYLRDAGT